MKTLTIDEMRLQMKKIIAVADTGEWYDEQSELDADDGSDIAITHDSLEHFITKWGKPLIEKTQIGTLYTWDKIQVAKGLMRGTLQVVDFGDVRAARFDGETK